MKGIKRVVIGSAVGGLLGAAAFFAVDGLMPRTAQADQLWRNSYGSPYSSGGSWTDGSGDYNDRSNTYGTPLGGPTIYSEKDNATYQCSTSGTCYKAWDGF